MKEPLLFLYKHIKPYKWWYVLILQAPFLTGFFPVFNNYSFKLVIDAFTKDVPNNRQIIYAIIMFFGAQISLDLLWRISNFAERKCEPFVRRNIILDVYNYVQNHHYFYFQNTQTGSVVSKVKGILGGYDSIFSTLHHKLGCYFFWTLFPIIGLFFVNYIIGIVVLIWAILFVLIIYPVIKKLNHFSNIEGDEKHLLFGMISDNVTNIFTLFAFAKRTREIKNLEHKIENGFVKAQIKTYKYDMKFNIIACLLYYPMLIFVFLFMLHCKIKGIITAGDFVFILSTFSMTICHNLWQFVSNMADFMKEIGDFKSSFSIMQVKQDVIDKKDARDLVI
ncbi:ABC transporter transmembrane domain-containing protein [Candidatus Deianiraea vastatrix]|uniref:ABC transporter ATP-binding/permease domain protein n=1 Tax=Candidatus Deianiraea vastatrix TaxID=2163644 RepID=A0A5B8XCS8_9RICK|nr:ABC transporter transmembrane domain-containing protein [Candidatus Deianiraea vastatrix]QED22856.1 Putative ABC transporter ATP-binding/permease domain protein [Candidatus Deianiraea vastatrix]